MEIIYYIWLKFKELYMQTLELEKLKYPIGKFIKPETISKTDVENWIAILESFPLSIENATKNLTSLELNWKYRPEGWTIKQVVHHCADSHMNSFIRFKMALTENFPTVKPYDEASWAIMEDGNLDDISSSIAIIKGLHHRWVVLLKNLSKEELQKEFINPESKKTYSIEGATGLYAWHCEHHLVHIKQALENKGDFNIA